MMNFLKTLARFSLISVVQIMIWMTLAHMIFHFHQPKPRPVQADSRFFLVCVMENGKSTHQFLEKYTPGQTLCRQEINPQYRSSLRNLGSSAHYLSALPNDEWLFEVWNDSPADPSVFHYRVEQDGSITPVSMTTGLLSYWFNAYVYGFIALAILWATGRRIRKSGRFKSGLRLW